MSQYVRDPKPASSDFAFIGLEPPKNRTCREYCSLNCFLVLFQMCVPIFAIAFAQFSAVILDFVNGGLPILQRFLQTCPKKKRPAVEFQQASAQWRTIWSSKAALLSRNELNYQYILFCATEKKYCSYFLVRSATHLRAKMGVDKITSRATQHELI